jgi:hypothetical protein
MQRHSKVVTFETADQICRDYLEFKRDIVNRPLNKLQMEQLAISAVTTGHSCCATLSKS